MFGFLRGSKRSRVYRQAYARCCSMQRTHCGFRALPLISYESVFVYCLGVDLGVVDPPRDSDWLCCKTRRAKRYEWTDNERNAAEFSTHFAMLLAETKLCDDVQDSGSWLARWYRFVLRKPIRRSRDFFRSLDENFDKSMQSHLDAHQNLENDPKHHALADYVRPTANAFATVFELFALAMDAESKRKLLHSIGADIGAAIIAFDCAVDWRHDQRRGHYNPLRNLNDVRDAYQYSIRRLVSAGWSIAEASPGNSIAADALKHRIATIAMRRRLDCDLESRSRTHQRKSRLARAGIIEADCLMCLCESTVCDWWVCCERGDSKTKKESKAERKKRKQTLRKKTRGGFVDCDCDCGGDACCCGGDLDCGSNDCGGEEDGFGFCATVNSSDMCCGAYCDSCPSKKSTDPAADEASTKSENTAEQDEMIGTTGESRTLLAPFGMIVADGKEYAAKSEGTAIEPGQTVQIIRREAFGFVVRVD